MKLRDLVRALLERDALAARQWVADAQRAQLDWSSVPPLLEPTDTERVVAAAVTELLAERAQQVAPAWTQSVGGLPTPMFLVSAAERMPRMRRLCEEESPRPLRERHLYAPPEFLTIA